MLAVVACALAGFAVLNLWCFALETLREIRDAVTVLRCAIEHHNLNNDHTTYSESSSVEAQLKES